MPKEKERKPESFQKEIPCLRMDFSELMNVLETMKLETDLIKADSNEAEFDGLDDIKSAPNRFSGEPRIVISRMQNGKVLAKANVEFNKKHTSVIAGEYKYSRFIKENNELAKYIYEELLPFSNSWELWTARITEWGSLIFTILIFSIFLSSDSWVGNDSLKIWGYEIPSSIFLVISFTGLAFLIINWFLKKRLPIKHNPRQTFLQKHGEAIVVGILVSVITAVITAYLI